MFIKAIKIRKYCIQNLTLILHKYYVSLLLQDTLVEDWPLTMLDITKANVLIPEVCLLFKMPIA